jgi:hypothetical protein
MDTKVMPLSDFQAHAEGALGRCYDSGEPLVVEWPIRGLTSIRPVEQDDDLVNQLIEHKPAFRRRPRRGGSDPARCRSSVGRRDTSGYSRVGVAL